MKRFLILGAGRQGSACAAFLLEQFDDTVVDFVDSRSDNLEAATALQREAFRVSCHLLDVSPPGSALTGLMADASCVISCVPYFLNVELTAASVAAATPFTDLGGNVDTVRTQLRMDDACKAAGVAIAPDCGLAPGLLNIMAETWARDWDYRSVRLYCGGLPQNPKGVLRYALTFNVCGLLNEYLDDCQVARERRIEIIRGLSEAETLSDLALPGEFEAFATSGGASLGPEIYAPQGVDYQYKTIRYPGHRDIIQAMWDMGFFDATERRITQDGRELAFVPRIVSGEIMEAELKSDGKDLVVARADVAGVQSGEARRGRVDLIDYAVDRFTAMERTTGFPTAITAAALAGMYDAEIEPGAYVPFQIIDPRLMLNEMHRAGVKGLTVREV